MARAESGLNGQGPLQYKADWPKAQERWTAFWEQSATDRPLLDIRAPTGRRLPPLPTPERWETKYLDPDYVERQWAATLEQTYFGADAVPTPEFLMGGYALGCDDRVNFVETTVWHPRMITRMTPPVNWHPGPSDPWRARLDRVIERLLEAAQGKFLVGYTGQVPLNDLLMLLRGTDEFLMELIERPEDCVRCLEEALPRWVENKEHLRDVVDRRQYGHVYGYPGLWAREYILATQSDMSCMISPALFERWVLRELDLLSERYPKMWYHLDGPGAIKHLDALLGRPYIRCIQYVSGSGQAPNGPAWMDLYRRVQRAGRCLEMSAPREHFEFLVRRLRPEGLLIRTNARTPAEAEELADRARSWAGSHAGEGAP